MDTQIVSKKKREFPDCFVVLFFLIIIVWAASQFIPTGVYDRYYDEVTGREIVDATSFHYVEQEKLGLMDLLTSVHDGFVSGADIIAMTFLIGAAFGVISKIGVLEIAIKKLAYSFRDKGVLVIPILMLVFGLIDLFTGTSELCMIYLPLIMPLMLALGFDRMTACAVVLVGSATGFTTAFANPFTVVLGQKLAGLPVYSGALFRIVVYVIVFAFATTYICRYASKVRKDPTKSILYNPNEAQKAASGLDNVADAKFTKRQAAAGISFIGVFIIMIVAVVAFGMSDFNQLDAFFFLLCVVPGIAGGLKSKELVKSIVDGAGSVLYGAILIGLARSVAVIMTNAGVMDTIIYVLAQAVQKLPSVLMPIGMEIVQTLINFLIYSGSGQCVVTMPIMLPLSDIVGVTRQTAIFAYQWGDGLSNILWPTIGYMMATLGLADVSYDKWIKWLWKPWAIMTVIGWCSLVVAHLINWGPF